MKPTVSVSRMSGFFRPGMRTLFMLISSYVMKAEVRFFE